jgi:hypothetical protein
MLAYVPFEIDELKDVLTFVTTLPVKFLVEILDLCDKVFLQDDTISAKLLASAEETIYPGMIRAEQIRAIRARKSSETAKEMSYFLEQLGVYVKASKPSGMTGRQIKTTGWLPITQAINPKGFESVRNSLTPDTWFDENEEEEKKTPENEEQEKQALIEEFERTGRIPLSLISSPKQYAKYILEHANVGFLEKSGTIGIDGYMKNIFYPTNRDKEEVQKKSQEAEVESVSIRSRWKGQKTERKLEGLDKAES